MVKPNVTKSLLADHSYSDLEEVGSWIRREIRPADEPWRGDSYELNYRLYNETGVCFTHRDFQDAMLLAGYQPVDPAEKFWRYRIVLTRDVNANPNPFTRWAAQFKDEDSPRGDFACDMLHDPDFPAFADHDIIRCYLEHHACPEALKAFEELWEEFLADRAR